jgi:hypothetical protein
MMATFTEANPLDVPLSSSKSSQLHKPVIFYHYMFVSFVGWLIVELPHCQFYGWFHKLRIPHF